MKHPLHFALPGLCLFCLTFLLPTPAVAQQQPTCCSIARNKGQQAFDKKDYAAAIRIWTDGKECPDKAKCPDLDALIKKAKDEQQKQKDAAAEAERRRQAELTRQREAERQRQAEQERRSREAAAKAADDAYDIAKAANNKAAYQAFLRNYPNSRHAADAKKRIAEIDKAAQPAPTTTTPSTTTTPAAPSGMARITGGAFTMGCTPEQKDCDGDESPTTRVTVSDFYMGKQEVTFDEYDAYCTATGREKPSDSGWGRGKRPVINVSWNDAVAYCNWRSEKEGLNKVYTISGSTVTANWNANGYRLPTEAEWEYAARGGGKAVLFGNGKNIANPREINFDGSSDYEKDYSIAGEYRQKTVPVGSLNSPNALGLHDMSGNVWEWCWDWHTTYPGGERNNYRGPDSGSPRVCRGGSWFHNPQSVRVAYRDRSTPGYRGNYLGFRLARAVR